MVVRRTIYRAPEVYREEIKGVAPWRRGGPKAGDRKRKMGNVSKINFSYRQPENPENLQKLFQPVRY